MSYATLFMVVSPAKYSLAHSPIQSTSRLRVCCTLTEHFAVYFLHCDSDRECGISGEISVTNTRHGRLGSGHARLCGLIDKTEGADIIYGAMDSFPLAPALPTEIPLSLARWATEKKSTC
ncbi:hypothetical protein L210DRAFT_949163 [Boletus edulis BED1]|uniref:Uncharacterized protein n=1 Tax=Boletus edulis BED1 TaxID=1328754 RepID=A0AAD4GE27_BOLED|nr:hypothetical protein L210DRAFT_949163 [Boletus edulis BED1]